MKIRKQVRALHKILLTEAITILRIHECSVFIDDAGECVLCMLLSIKKIFAALHLAREHKLCLEWIPTEKQLYDLLGEKAFFNKIEIELKEVVNFPRKQCKNCGHIVTFYCSFKRLARRQNSEDISTKCGYCGLDVELTELPHLPPSKEKNEIKENIAPRLRSRSIPPIVHRKLTLEDLGATILEQSRLSENIPQPPPVIAPNHIIYTGHIADTNEVIPNIIFNHMINPPPWEEP